LGTPALEQVCTTWAFNKNVCGGALVI